ncbi:NAD(P)/FAD-dependent oxidoreductase [Nocardioides zeae]|uniref:NAD(P)/FAD-dependent oxidoreductase n=1 Tax=Nocardioides imazamoxiresistens TaxID=3231893 RepID=A0ABU3PVN0_9ACTN|nr:NAD(P)/FAD-dependent oxidoreductase [Nocardioides zeae]MDT9593302.1 NAD(P)/FAD-dependent oxidoreductase [Nocardioides zeae]
MTEAGSSASRFDVVVVGAGLAGLYALHRLRGRGLAVQVVEAAPDIGGTWYWNAYPGARCDVESMDYSYSFSPELDQEWTWSELYPAQPEILSYIHHVAERFDLRRDVRLSTTVSAATYDEERARWSVVLETGETLDAQYVVFATGSLSAPLDPPFEGFETFGGEWYQTSRWPHEEVSFDGRRVVVIGTGSSGVQSIPVIAETAAAVTVLQRTPNFSIPARNRPLDAEEVARRKAVYPAHRQAQRDSPSGVTVDVNPRSAHTYGAEEAQDEMRRRWEFGGAPIFNVAFVDTMTDVAANTLLADFVRDRIREKVSDPATAELLIPTDHPIAAKRLCCDTNYFETYNAEHVELVDVRSNPIRRVVRDGVELSDGTVHQADTIVYAVGYDALSGALGRIDIRGTGGRRLADEWRDAGGPSTYLGLAVHGFPNMFTVTGPGSPSVLAVMIVAIEQHVEWIDDCLAHLAEHGLGVIEATEVAQKEWTDRVEEVIQGTVFPLATNSYYGGANVPGKWRRIPLWAGGQKAYRDICADVARRGYEGFALRAAPSPLREEVRG